ncbi:hypothetical protein [Falsiporphyromonas endometrii]|uniref:Uncharacterized protein n=1 Tax=Falsiporphyromonas endometrii TaxID=1387297 RepID=A0ABV9K5K5_9PORP
MEISILLTILSMIVSLGGLFPQAGEICLVKPMQIRAFKSVKFNLRKILSQWAVKLVLRGLYLLNTVILIGTQKVAQSTIIQLQNHNFRG